MEKRFSVLESLVSGGNRGRFFFFHRYDDENNDDEKEDRILFLLEYDVNLIIW